MDSANREHEDLKADTYPGLLRLLNRLFIEVHKVKATRQQHIMFELADLASLAETGAALVNKIAQGDDLPSDTAAYLGLCSRVDAALFAQRAFTIANEILLGSGLWSPEEASVVIESSGFDYQASQAGLILDMDTLRNTL